MKSIAVYGGARVSEIIFGGTKRGTGEGDLNQFPIMDRFFESGGTTFDSARVYGNGASDVSLGKWIKSNNVRKQVVICTKGSHPERHTMHISRLRPEQIIGDLDLSLEAIGTDYTDIHILHRDDPKLPVDEIMQALDSQVKAGKIKAIGTSNWSVGRINQANQYAAKNSLTPFSISQTNFSLAQTTPMLVGDVTQVPMNDIEFSWYKETGMPVMCFSAIAKGYFSKYAQGREQSPGVLRCYDFFPENRRRAERVKRLSREMGCPIASLLVAYVRDCGINGAALCGFSSQEQLEDALWATRIALTPQQVRYLETGEE